MINFSRWIDKLFRQLFILITQQNASSEIIRFAITFLDVWQAVIILNHNYWIPNLVDTAIPFYYYTWYTCILAVLAILAFFWHRALWLSLIVLGINWLTYMFLTFAGLNFSDTPKVSVGFSAFVMFVSISAFWRVLLIILRDRAIRKRI